MIEPFPRALHRTRRTATSATESCQTSPAALNTGDPLERKHIESFLASARSHQAVPGVATLGPGIPGKYQNYLRLEVPRMAAIHAIKEAGDNPQAFETQVAEQKKRLFLNLRPPAQEQLAYQKIVADAANVLANSINLNAPEIHRVEQQMWRGVIHNPADKTALIEMTLEENANVALVDQWESSNSLMQTSPNDLHAFIDQKLPEEITRMRCAFSHNENLIDAADMLAHLRMRRDVANAFLPKESREQYREEARQRWNAVQNDPEEKAQCVTEAIESAARATLFAMHYSHLMPALVGFYQLLDKDQTFKQEVLSSALEKWEESLEDYAAREYRKPPPPPSAAHMANQLQNIQAATSMKPAAASPRKPQRADRTPKASNAARVEKPGGGRVTGWVDYFAKKALRDGQYRHSGLGTPGRSNTPKSGMSDEPTYSAPPYTQPLRFVSEFAGNGEEDDTPSEACSGQVISDTKIGCVAAVFRS